MKHVYLWLMFFFSYLLMSSSFALAQSNQGLTGVDPATALQQTAVRPATLAGPSKLHLPIVQAPLSPRLGLTDDWQLLAVDSASALVPPGEQLTVYFDPITEDLGFLDPTAQLSAVQEAAIARAPIWLRSDLRDNFRRFAWPNIADQFAQEVLNAPDPFVDEVAFQAAHISPGVLYYTPLQLLLENARFVYTVDSVLDYVQIVDYGTAAGDDYWSTTRYRIIEQNGDTTEYELDRDTYYWFIVHPKLSDENPLYINPATGGAADPPDGVFWRTYLWTHADPGYPLLSTSFGGTDFLWAHLTNTSGAANGGVGLLNSWINAVMDFGAGAERPIQPVRIYTLHCGNCGEFADITTAAARTALIPCNSPLALCEDHTWNEFWDGEWIHWEPVNNYINCPLAYETGWGKIFSGIYTYRGDGYAWNVTERYSVHTSTLNVTVTDSCGKPADGVRVSVYSNAIFGGLYPISWANTNSAGITSIELGDNRNYWMRLDGPLGPYPSAGVNYIIGNAVPDSIYYWEYAYENATPNLDVSQAPPYSNPRNEYQIEIEYVCDYEATYGIYYSGSSEFQLKLNSGITDFFIANAANYSCYSVNVPAQVFEHRANSISDTVSYILPTHDYWYAALSSRELGLNRPLVRAVAKVYKSDVLPPVSLALAPVNPPVQIPAGGGRFSYSTTLTNNTTQPQSFQAWIMIRQPSASWFGPVLGPLTLTLNPSVSVTRVRSQNVPGNAQAGEYAYEGRIGTYPDSLKSHDAFTFTKLDGAGQNVIADWSNTERSQTALVPSGLQMTASPNPFNPSTVATYQLQAASHVSLKVYDTAGRRRRWWRGGEMRESTK
jgi:hypothetical protein